MNVNQFHNVFRIVSSLSPDFVNCPRMFLNSGLNLSVQASLYHYSQPRVSNADYYSAFEIGFPSEKIESIMDYAEDTEMPTETVYGYVPDDVIDKIIQDNGGIDLAKMMEGYISLYNQTFPPKTPKKEIVEFYSKGYTKEEVLELLKAIKG